MQQVAGPSGCGKTQFCMMMSMIAVLPSDKGGLGGSVIFIDTESAFSAERYVTLVLFYTVLLPVFNGQI